MRLSNALNLIVGQNVHGARCRAGKRQDEVALALQVSRPAVSQLEAGNRRLTLPEAVALADYLKCPLRTLTRGLLSAGG